MDRDTMLTIGLLAGAALLLGGAGAAVVLAYSSDRKALVKFTTDGSGLVVQTPADVADELARKMGKPVTETEAALATMIASEEGSAPVVAKVGVAWAARNYAARKGVALLSLLAKNGRLGPQNVGGRYASTARPPSRQDVEIAQAVLSGAEKDPTGGAVQFDSPKAQRALVARSTTGYSKGPEEVAASRTSEGKVEVHLPGVDPDDLRFWRYA